MFESQFLIWNVPLDFCFPTDFFSFSSEKRHFKTKESETYVFVNFFCCLHVIVRMRQKINDKITFYWE